MSDFDGLDKTEHLGLFKPTLENVADIRSMSENMDLIDAAITADRAAYVAADNAVKAYIAQKYLPLTGGTLTGALKVSVITGQPKVGDQLAITASEESGEQGAYVSLCKASHALNPCGFSIAARNTKNSNAVNALLGYADGRLVWNRDEVDSKGNITKYHEHIVRSVNGVNAADTGNVTVNVGVKTVNSVSPDSNGNVVYSDIHSSGSNWVRFANGTQICRFEVPVTTGGTTVTLPAAFVDNKYAVLANTTSWTSYLAWYDARFQSFAKTTVNFKICTNANNTADVLCFGRWK